MSRFCSHVINYFKLHKIRLHWKMFETLNLVHKQNGTYKAIFVCLRLCVYFFIFGKSNEANIRNNGMTYSKKQRANISEKSLRNYYCLVRLCCYY